MRDFLYRLRCSLSRFLYGRNGADTLGMALLLLQLVLSFVSSLIRVPALSRGIHYVTLVLWGVLIWRTLSRDLAKRRAENAKFLRWWSPKKAALQGARARMADREHKYVRCGCGAFCRVPRGVGKVELTCPKCGKKKIVKT